MAYLFGDSPHTSWGSVRLRRENVEVFESLLDCQRRSRTASDLSARDVSTNLQCDRDFDCPTPQFRGTSVQRSSIRLVWTVKFECHPLTVS